MSANKKSKKKGPWDDWDTHSTVWKFDVGKKKARENGHGLEDLEKIRYFKDKRHLYKNATFPGTLVAPLVRKLIEKYSNKGEIILDPFLGSGTTIIEARILDRKLMGCDINPGAIELCKRKLKQKTLFQFNLNFSARDFKIKKMDALSFLKRIDNNYISLILVHPPYWKLFKFTDDKKDLSSMNLEDYLKYMKELFHEMYRVLEEDRFCVIIIGDKRKSGYVPLGFYLAQLGLVEGFNLWDIIIYDSSYKSKKYDIYRQLTSKKYKFHLQNHDYILVFRKRKLGWNPSKVNYLLMSKETPNKIKD